MPGATTTDRLQAMSHMARCLEDFVVPCDVDGGEYYGWVSLPENEFFDGLEIARTTLVERDKCFSWPRFLDVGCGIGTKLLLAQAFGFDVAGIELQPAYAEIARALLPDAAITVANAFAYDGYGEFDVVYAFRPCVDLELQNALSQHIASLMKPGALFFLAGCRLDGYEHVADQVWRI